MLPGPKALPNNRRYDPAATGTVVGVTAGDLAPDLVLIDAEDPQHLWRLSNHRGASQLLVFVRPGCANCDDELRRAVEAAALSGVQPVIIRTPSPPLATTNPYSSLVWERAGAALFEASASVEYALIDAQGIIEARPADAAETAALLSASPADG